MLPREMADNPARNTYFFLPFLLGILGLIYQLNRDQRNFTVVMWLFVMMGVALVVYFNTCPSEPRERDYVYAGSFYAFSIWIGLGVLALRDFFAYIMRRDSRAAAIVATVVCLGVPTLLAALGLFDAGQAAVFGRVGHVVGVVAVIQAAGRALEVFQAAGRGIALWRVARGRCRGSRFRRSEKKSVKNKTIWQSFKVLS